MAQRGAVVVTRGAMAWSLPPCTRATKPNVQFAQRLVIPLDGSVIAFRDGHGREVETAAPVVVPRGVSYATLRGGSRLGIAIHPLCDGRAIAVHERTPEILTGARAEHVRGVARDLLGSRDMADPGDLQAAVLKALVAPIGRLVDRRVRLVLDALACEAAPPTLGDLAAHTRTSQDYLRHLVAQELGETVRGLARWFRFTRMVEQLWQPTSLAQIAASSGYTDQAHLARTCRSLVGHPPSLRNQLTMRLHGTYYTRCA